MIPPIREVLGSSAREAAIETTDRAKEMFHSFYSQVSCTDLSAIQSECNPKGGFGKDAEGAVALDWRADPFLSMSDLTLVVYDGSGGTPYHVHTLLLAHGGRKSGFVAEQIKGQQKGQQNKAKTGGKKNAALAIQRQNSSNSHGSNSNAEYKVDIFVPALAARSMPLFLDYVYGSSLKLTTATAPPLRYLSNRFDCRDLHKEVTLRFIPQDLELSTAPRYCTMADELKDFEMRDRSVRLMAERFEKLNVNLLKEMGPRLVRSVLQSERLECGSERLSLKVAQYLRLREDLAREGAAEEEEHRHLAPLTDEDYYWLTHCAHMPKIHPKEGLFYFQYSVQFPQVMNEVGSGSLRARCLAACAERGAMEKLTSHLEDSERNPMELYANLEPKMKVQLLESTLVGAQHMIRGKEEEYTHRNQSERDTRLSEKLMYKHNNRGASKLVVLGAGVAPANGLYHLKGHQAAAENTAAGHRDPDEVIVYEKHAVWKQQPVTFVLYPTKSGQYYTQYKLGVVQHAATTVLYNSPTCVGARGDGIPEQAWEVEEDAAEGLHPPPQFVGRVAPP